jgi:hypothetical protein
MNGAIAELCANTKSTPKTRMTNTIGNIHQRLLAIRNESNSLATPSRVVAVRRIRICTLLVPRRLGDQSCSRGPYRHRFIVRLTGVLDVVAAPPVRQYLILSSNSGSTRFHTEKTAIS